MSKSVILALLLIPAFAHGQSVDILWQGGNYVPPFYQGRNLWTSQSEVTFVAITQGLPNPAELTYKWIRNGTVLGLVSGVGKDSLTFMDTIFSKPVTISIEILDVQENVLAENKITLVPTAPEILVYEDNPLLGYMFHQEASAGYRLKDNEITLAAFPLFFTAFAREYPSLRYSWRSNAGEDSAIGSVTYRAPEKTSGSSAVSVSLANTDFFKQSARKSFLIQFNGNE